MGIPCSTMGTALPPTPSQKSQTADVMWRACVAEFVSCFMFVFVSTGANLSSGALYAGMTAARLLLIALASGFSYTFIMYSATQISGGVMNPAILLACVLTGNIGIVSSIFYFVSQLIGYIMGAAMLKAMVPEKYHADLGSQQLGHGMNFGQGVMMEFMLTATLTFVYFSTAIDPRRVHRMGQQRRRVSAAYVRWVGDLSI